MKLKGIDIFCASQASTAICFSMEQASSSSSSVIQLGGRAIDRHNPIIQDSRRSNAGSTSARFINPPCNSHPPINPKTYHQLQKSKKNSSASKPSDQQSKKKIVSFSKEKYEQKRKSTSSIPKRPSTDDNVKKYSSVPSAGSVVRKSCAEPVDLLSTTPPGSTRYLLSDKVFFDGLSDYDSVLGSVPVEDNKENHNTLMSKQENESASSASSSSSLSKSPPPSDQVVVLRVSLHCRGCEGKLRKHLSRMEGVTSFNIDFAAKKVTVMGDVTPVSVLASVSKVKNAQFWPTVSATPSASPATCPTKLDAKHLHYSR